MAANSRRKCEAELRRIRVVPPAPLDLQSKRKVITMRLVIGSDHAGWALKKAVIEHVRSLGHEVIDVGSLRRQAGRLSRTSRAH